MIKVIDNALSDPLFKSLKDIVLGNDFFPWYLGTDINVNEDPVSYYVQNKNSVNTNQLTHHLYVDVNHTYGQGDVSSHTKFVHKLIMPVLKKHKIFGHIVRSKFNLLFPNPNVKDNQYNIPHYDLDDAHYSVLLYLNNSDGDTVFFEEKNQNKKLTNLTEIKRVQPKENRLVISDGHYHTSSNPKKHQHRIVLNIVVKKGTNVI